VRIDAGAPAGTDGLLHRWLTVRLAPTRRHWECFVADHGPTYLYIDRRTGRFRLDKRRSGRDGPTSG
jgi:hypothetical protein